MFEFYKEDVMRYFPKKPVEKDVSFWKMFVKTLKTEQLWIIALYRYRRWVQKNVKIPVINTLMILPYRVVSRPLEMIFGVSIAWRAEIGKGLYIGHCGSIWIGPIKMGEYCIVSQEVTLGVGGQGDNRGIPEVGNRVFFGPGAKIVGRITIGNNVAIGPNSVVTKNIPDNATVLGNPGRIVGYDGSKDYIDVSSEEEVFSRIDY